MTRAQRSAHRVAWIVVGLALLALSAWAIHTRSRAHARMASEARS